MVTRTLTFQPTKISTAARTSTPRTTLSGSRARTAPAPTRRTTPARRTSLSEQLSSTRRPSGGSVPLIRHQAAKGAPTGGGSILEQFFDLAKNLPQGLVGFGKDVLTDVVAPTRALVDLVKDQELRGIEEYLPASTGMAKSFGNTAYDLSHPQEFIDAWNEGRIVSKVVEDVGNVAIFAGGISKALGAGASTGIMSAEEAAQFAARGAGKATGRTLEEAAAAGVKGAREALEAQTTSLADAGQFGGRVVGEYTLPRRGLGRLVDPATAESMRTAGNVVRKYGRYGEQAGNVPALPYQYMGRGINKLAEAAGIEGGLSGGLRRAATRVAPEVMFRSTAAGQATRSAMAEAERAGTRATRFVLDARERAQQLGLDEAEQEALGLMIDVPNLAKGLEDLDDAALSEYLDNEFAYGDVELDQRPTIPTVRKLMEYRARNLPADRLKAMDEVQDILTGIAQDRTQRMLGPEPAKFDTGEPATAGAPRPLFGRVIEPQSPPMPRSFEGASAWADERIAQTADDLRYMEERETLGREPVPPVFRTGEPPGVAPGRPVVGDTPRGLHPEQLGTTLRETQVSEYIGTREKRRDKVQRRLDTRHAAAIRESRIYDAMLAVNESLPPPPDPRVAFREGRMYERARNGDSIARRRWEQAQRALSQALDEYVKISEGGPSAAVRAAEAEVDRLTVEVNRIREMVERNERRVDAASALTKATGGLEEGAPRLLDESRQAPAPEIIVPEPAVTPNFGREPQEIRRRAEAISEEAGVEAHGAIEQMVEGMRPALPEKGAAGGEYDWWKELDAPTRRRMQREGFMAGRTEARRNPVNGKVERVPVEAFGPDVVTETINRNLGTDMSVSEAMGRYVDAVRRYWDAKSGKSADIIDRVADEMQLPRENVQAAVRGRIADYSNLVVDQVTSSFHELRDAFQTMDPETQASFIAATDDIVARPGTWETGDIADVLQGFFPDLDFTSPAGIMTMIDGQVELADVVDWVRGGTASVLPPTVRAKMRFRGEQGARALGRLEGAVTGAKRQALDTESELARADYALARAEGADARAEVRAAERIGTAQEAEFAARPEQGPKLAETLKPDVATYDPWRRRTGTTKTGQTTTPLSPAERMRVQLGQQKERAHRARADTNRLRKSVQRYNEQIAKARDELSRSFQDRLDKDVNRPAAAQMRRAVESGGKPLGNVWGSGDSASISNTIAFIGDKYGVYDDFVQALDETRHEMAREVREEAGLELDPDRGPNLPVLTAAQVAQVVDDVLRGRPDVVLDGPDRILLEDAIGSTTLSEDINTTMRNELDGGRRLNSPYRIYDVINAHGWNMPAEVRAKVRAAFDRYQVRRANTMHQVYNQWTKAVPARFRPAVQAGQRQIAALIDIAESRNKSAPGSGDVYLDIAESTMSTLDQLVKAGIDPVHLTGGRPARQTSAASAATGGGLGQTKLRGQRTRKTGLRQLSLDAYARVEAEEATTWIRNQRNAHLERELGVRADALPEVQEALADWAAEHYGETMPPRTLGKIAEDAGFVPIESKDVIPGTILVPKRVYDVLKPASYNNLALRALSRTNRAFKTWVLPFSPKWQIGNILGNVIQASVHGGVGPVELLSTMRRIAKYEGGILKLWQQAGLPEWTRAEIANHGLTMDEYRTLRDLDDKPPRTPIGYIARSSFRLNEFVDNLTRSSVDLAALARGESTDQALQTTIRSLGDYSRMSTFERKVIREVIPFYAWIRHSTTATLRLPITSPARAAFLFHLADIYRDPEEQGELFGSRIELGGGLLNLGTINPLQDVTDFIAPGELIGPNLSPTLKAISTVGFGLDLSKMDAISRPESTALLDPYGRPKTTAPITKLFHDPLAGIGEVAYSLSQQSPGAIKNLRDYALGDDVRYGGTGYRVGDLTDPRKRSISTLLRALNLPTLDRPPDTRS